MFDREHFRYHINNPSAWDAYDDRISNLMRAADNEIERLLAALEPFGRFCEVFPADWKDAEPVTHSDADGDRDLTLGDLRRAAALINQQSTQDRA